MSRLSVVGIPDLQAGEDVKITLPFPNADLNPNRAHGRHWGALAKLKKDARKQAYLETQIVLKWKMFTCSGFVPLTLTFFMSDHRKRDADNLLASAKGAIDGVAEALRFNDHGFEPVTIKRVYGAEKSMLLLEIGP